MIKLKVRRRKDAIDIIETSYGSKGVWQFPMKRTRKKRVIPLIEKVIQAKIFIFKGGD